MMYVEDKKGIGFWCGSRKGEFVSKWIDDVRKKVMEWLREDEDLGIIVGENNVVKFVSYVKMVRKGKIGRLYRMDKWRIWEDCIYGEEGNVEVLLWNDVLCKYDEDKGYVKV